jgi:hypothetical protein
VTRRNVLCAGVTLRSVDPVNLDEIRKTIIGSTADDWLKIADGPVFLGQLDEAAAKGQRYVRVDSHSYLAVYLPDVSLRMAWGIEQDRD